MKLLKNIPISFIVWKFSFNELCDLKNLKKLISGSCPTPIFQSYINNLKNIYIWAWSTQNALWYTYCFVNLFHNIQLFSIFRKWPHLISTSFYTHVFPSQLFFYCFQKLKNQRYHFEEDASMCGMCILKIFLDVYFLPCGFFFELLRSCCQVFYM